MENGTGYPKPSSQQSAYDRANAAAEAGRPPLNYRLPLTAINYGYYNAYESVATPGDYTSVDPGRIYHADNQVFAPSIDSNPSSFTGSTFGPYNHGFTRPNAPDPNIWEVTGASAHSNNNTSGPFTNVNHLPLTENASGAFPTAPTLYNGAAAPVTGPMDSFNDADFQYPGPTLPGTISPYAAGHNGTSNAYYDQYYHGPVSAPNSNAFSGATIGHPTALQAVDSIVTPLNLTPPGNQRYTCVKCNKSIGRKGDLDRHAKTHRANANVFRCPYAGCGFDSYRKDKVREHIRRRHAGVGNVVVIG